MRATKESTMSTPMTAALVIAEQAGREHAANVRVSGRPKAPAQCRVAMGLCKHHCNTTGAIGAIVEAWARGYAAVAHADSEAELAAAGFWESVEADAKKLSGERLAAR